jgi:hypothetical protein
MPNVPNAVAMRRAEFGLRVLTAILIAFAGGLVLLELSARYGLTIGTFEAQTF